MVADQMCPCGSGLDFLQCCGPLLEGTATAQTAEALMRSRYTANVVQDTRYLGVSWHACTRPADPAAASGVQWRRLIIREVVDGGPQDDTGVVEFIAHFRTADGTRDFLHERSRFVQEHGRWLYVDGDIF